MITRVIREGLEGLVLKDTKAGSRFLATGVCWEWRGVDEAHEAGPPWNIPGFLRVLISSPGCSVLYSYRRTV